MKTLRLTLIGAITAAALALPATAVAGPGVADLAKRLDRADAAAAYSAWAAQAGNEAHATRAFRRFERVATRAEVMARAIDGRRARARAMRALGTSADDALDRFADVLDQLPAHTQPVVADAIGSSAELREHVIRALARLAEHLPEPARTAVLDAITAFLSDGDVEALVDALTSDDVITPIKQIVLGHLEMITGHLEGVFERLDGLSATLPAPAREPFAIAIAAVQEQLQGISEMIGGILGSLPIGDLGGGDLPGIALPGGITGGLCDLIGGLPLPIALPVICE